MAVTVAQVLEAIKQHESGGNYKAVNSAGAYGAYQFIPSTWNSNARAAGYPQYANGRADLAPPAVQDAVALYHANQALVATGGDPIRIADIWYLGHVASPAELDVVPSPGAGNTITPRQYEAQIAKAVGASTGGTTVSTVNPGVAPASVPFNPANVDQIIRQNYGYEAWALNIPELKAALTQALSDHGTVIDAATLEGYVKNTQWWKTNSITQRNFIQAQGEDPAQAAAQVAQAASQVLDLGIRYGLAVPPDRANQIATDSVRFGWTSTQLNQAMISEAFREGNLDPAGNPIGGIGPNGAFTQGELASNYALVSALSEDYAVWVDPGTAEKWAAQLTGGQLTQAGLQGTLQQRALAKYAGDHTTTVGLQSGFTVRDLATDQINAMAKMLGVSADTINLNDPKWGQIVNYRDPATGGTRMMNTAEAQTLVRNSPTFGWDTTADANSATSSALKAFTEDMGRVKF